MPTIQIKMNDDEYLELLRLTNQSTGTKAVQAMIYSYEQLLIEKAKLDDELEDAMKKLEYISGNVDIFFFTLDKLRENKLPF